MKLFSNFKFTKQSIIFLVGFFVATVCAILTRISKYFGFISMLAIAFLMFYTGLILNARKKQKLADFDKRVQESLRFSDENEIEFSLDGNNLFEIKKMRKKYKKNQNTTIACFMLLAICVVGVSFTYYFL